MGVPGSNLLSQALTVIASEEFTYFPFTGNTTLTTGMKVPNYGPGEALYGSVQAVENKLLATLGLDWKKRHIMIYVSNSIFGPERGTGGDRVEYLGSNYQVESENYWTRMDGWTGILCVQIAGAPT